jgi:hypothetical protein
MENKQRLKVYDFESKSDNPDFVSRIENKRTRLGGLFDYGIFALIAGSIFLTLTVSFLTGANMLMVGLGIFSLVGLIATVVFIVAIQRAYKIGVLTK